MEERKAERYIWGLKTAIHEFIEIQKPDTFQSAVDPAEGRDWKVQIQTQRKARPFSSYCDYEQQSGKGQCTICKRFHKGECNMNQRTCYKCRKIGHIAPDCKICKVCYGCGSPNHIRSNCPQNKGNNNQRMMTEKGNRSGDE
uniref:CCHC-type domain-containing protein n=1 Tax=Lactuca sativa TaxID=4236 RepID=A0A9R1V5K9_LACSA|nr:hypothetical protein LSAT_V11C600337010 [Lactuca sativa]